MSSIALLHNERDFGAYGEKRIRRVTLAGNFTDPNAQDWQSVAFKLPNRNLKILP
jgi:hypothetical protein